VTGEPYRDECRASLGSERTPTRRPISRNFCKQPKIEHLSTVQNENRTNIPRQKSLQRRDARSFALFCSCIRTNEIDEYSGCLVPLDNLTNHYGLIKLLQHNTVLAAIAYSLFLMQVDAGESTVGLSSNRTMRLRHIRQTLVGYSNYHNVSSASSMHLSGFDDVLIPKDKRE
jgi:hypothetical protein